MADFKHKNTDLSLITDQNDLDLIRQYTENYDRAYAAGDKAGQQAAHDAAEKIRSKYQYSGGTDGSDYIKLGSGETLRQPSAPKADTSWLDKLGESSYQYDADGKISAALDAMLNRKPFSYDAVSDPLYQQYRKQYTREADRSAEDVLGKAAVMTGGMPSTAAVTASQQASDYQMSQMTDKIPELQQLAYGMYMDGINLDRQNLNTLIGLEDNNYSRWLRNRDYLYQLARDQVGDQQYADSLAYQKEQNKLKYDYQKERDAIEDARYDTEWQYKLQQAALQAAQKASGGGRSSGGARGGMKLSTAKDMAKQGIFSDDVLQAFYNAGYNDEYLTVTYGYDPNGNDEPKGYGTVRNQGMKASEWEAVLNNIRTNLREGRVETAKEYMKQVSGGMNEEQYNEAEALFTKYGA
nr:MAG TPA: hypothetical protein [Caudoviricetes sp.]